MTTDQQAEKLAATAAANQSRINFEVATNVIAGLLADHNGTLPTAHKDDDATRKRYIAELDERVFETLNAMLDAVGTLHKKILETHHLTVEENPYRHACRAVRVHLEGVLAKHKGPITLGHFHDNIWLIAERFEHDVKMGSVVPSTRMKNDAARLAAREAARAAQKLKEESTKAKTAKRPAGRGLGRGQGNFAGVSTSSCIPQYH